jgi:hypothetical protein
MTGTSAHPVEVGNPRLNRRERMQVVLLSQEQLIENAIAVHPDVVVTIIRSVEPWDRDAALALLLQDAFGWAPAN